MELRIRGLGRIREACLDLRPLTVFVGPNSTNKTWVAYAYYGLLSEMARHWPGQPRDWVALPSPVQGEIRRRVDEWMGDADPSPTVELRLQARRADLVDESTPLCVALESRACAEILGVANEATATSNVELEVAAGELWTCSAVVLSLRALRVEFADFLDASGDRIWRAAYGYTTPRGDAPSLKRSLLSVLTELVMPRVPHALALPAERSLLSVPGTALGSGVAAPLSDYARFLDASAVRLAKRTISSDSIRLDPKLVNDVLGGEILVADSRFVFLPTHQAAPVGLTAVASLVKSLSGLPSYLRSYASPHDVLIIDEPEINAHPEAIARLTELLAILVNRGIRVLVTTHSPYLLDHLSSLIDGSQLSSAGRSDLASRLWTGNEEALLLPDKVSVYLFEDSAQGVTARQLLDRSERSIDWETFSGVSNRIAEVYEESQRLRTLAEARRKTGTRQ